MPAGGRPQGATRSVKRRRVRSHSCSARSGAAAAARHLQGGGHRGRPPRPCHRRRRRRARTATGGATTARPRARRDPPRRHRRHGGRGGRGGGCASPRSRGDAAQAQQRMQWMVRCNAEVLVILEGAQHRRATRCMTSAGTRPLCPARAGSPTGGSSSTSPRCTTCGRSATLCPAALASTGEASVVNPNVAMAFVQGIPIRAGGATAVVMVFTFRQSRLLLFTLAISMTVDPGDVKGMVIAASKFLAARMVEHRGMGCHEWL